MISVIVPTHNEEKIIGFTLGFIKKSKFDNYEVLVVDDGSTDKTKEIVRNFKDVILIEQENMGPAAARNLGARKARGEILFFLDADDFLKPDTLYKINNFFEKHNPEFLIANRKALVPTNWRRVFIYGNLIRKDHKLNLHDMKPDNQPCPYISSRAAFFDVGCFDEKYYYTEDREFSKRLTKLNRPRMFSEDIVYYSVLRESWPEFENQCRNVARSLTEPLRISRILKLIGELLGSVITFPAFYLCVSVYAYLKTKDILIAISSPALFIIRRVFEFEYFLRGLLGRMADKIFDNFIMLGEDHEKI